MVKAALTKSRRGTDVSFREGLASRLGAWQRRTMDQQQPRKKPEPRSAGILLAIGPILGTVVGSMRGQPTIGFLIGLGAAIGLAGLLWLIDTRR
jgi:UDP-N-acetylmuramyl pentapeptide phosphotransferase/UDP-N-acetylglucosamine-1-phosphate transferase